MVVLVFEQPAGRRVEYRTAGTPVCSGESVFSRLMVKQQKIFITQIGIASVLSMLSICRTIRTWSLSSVCVTPWPAISSTSATRSTRRTGSSVSSPSAWAVPSRRRCPGSMTAKSVSRSPRWLGAKVYNCTILLLLNTKCFSMFIISMSKLKSIEKINRFILEMSLNSTDRPFHNFGAMKSVVRRSLTT